MLNYPEARKIGIEGIYNKFSVSSSNDIQNVLIFFSTQHPLMGYKLVQFNNFVSQLKSMPKGIVWFKFY